MGLIRDLANIAATTLVNQGVGALDRRRQRSMLEKALAEVQTLEPQFQQYYTAPLKSRGTSPFLSLSPETIQAFVQNPDVIDVIFQGIDPFSTGAGEIEKKRQQEIIDFLGASGVNAFKNTLDPTIGQNFLSSIQSDTPSFPSGEILPSVQAFDQAKQFGEQGTAELKNKLATGLEGLRQNNRMQLEGVRQGNRLEIKGITGKGDKTTTSKGLNDSQREDVLEKRDIIAQELAMQQVRQTEDYRKEVEKYLANSIEDTIDPKTEEVLIKTMPAYRKALAGFKKDKGILRQAADERMLLQQTINSGFLPEEEPVLEPTLGPAEQEVLIPQRLKGIITPEEIKQAKKIDASLKSKYDIQQRRLFVRKNLKKKGHTNAGQIEEIVNLVVTE